MRWFTAAGLTLCALVVSPPVGAQARRARSEQQRADVEVVLAKARAAYEALEYDRVMPLTDRVILEEPERSPARCTAYALKGSALAGMGNAPDAETVFTSLVAECPAYDLPAGTSPRIRQPFDKARAAARAEDDARRAEHQRRIAGIALLGEHPTRAVAGDPLEFDYELRDPANGVHGVGVRYRRSGAERFDELSLARDAERWSAALSGEWTASHPGAKIEFYVATVDRTGSPLLTVGTPTEPLVAVIEPLDARAAVPLYRKTWFWVAAAGVLAVGVTSALLIAGAGDVPDSDLGSYEFP